MGGGRRDDWKEFYNGCYNFDLYVKRVKLSSLNDFGVATTCLNTGKAISMYRNFNIIESPFTTTKWPTHYICGEVRHLNSV